MSAQPPYAGPAVAIIYLLLEPGPHKKVIRRPKTARQLLAALNIGEERALVIRDSCLLTPDRHIWPGDNILVQLAGSRG